MCRKQLKDWGLDYFDLYIMHFRKLSGSIQSALNLILTSTAVSLDYVDPAVRYPPGWFHDGVTPTDIRPGKATIRETWEAMEALVPLGLTRSIGISNFNVGLILDLLRYAKIRPATLQIEHHPYLVQKALTDFAQGQGLTVTAYSSFGPTGYIEMDMDNAIKTPHLFEHPVILEVAKAHGVSAPQVLLRWATQNGIAVIPKADTPAMATENLAAKGFDLTTEEIKKINGLDRNLRFNDPLTVSNPARLKKKVAGLTTCSISGACRFSTEAPAILMAMCDDDVVIIVVDLALTDKRSS